MKRVWVAGLLAVIVAGCGGGEAVEVDVDVDLADPVAAPTAWNEELDAAMREAREDQKPILMYFNGSDWCLPCEDWWRRILGAQEFLEFASTELVLLELDFPLRAEQAMVTVHQNEALQSRFEVSVFPTLLLATPEGEEIGRMAGTMPDRPRDFIHWVNENRHEGM